MIERIITSPIFLFPSMASFLFWQLWQRNGPSQGRSFPGLDAPSCIEIPSPGFISAWQIAHVNSLNMLQSGYFVCNLHYRQKDFSVRRNYMEHAANFNACYTNLPLWKQSRSFLIQLQYHIRLHIILFIIGRWLCRLSPKHGFEHSLHWSLSLCWRRSRWFLWG